MENGDLLGGRGVAGLILFPLTLQEAHLMQTSDTCSHLSPISQKAQLLPWQVLEVLGATFTWRIQTGVGGHSSYRSHPHQLSLP